MLLLVSNGLGFFWLLDHPTYGGVAACFEHVAWDGLMFWDLVQPAFACMQENRGFNPENKTSSGRLAFC